MARSNRSAIGSRIFAMPSHPLVPFHWEFEFTEVFERNNPGFDAFVGNPPFAGKNTISAANPTAYIDWLKQIHSESHGNSDLVAHFFRRTFNLLRQNGILGLIATNTIGQGDTRSTRSALDMSTRRRDFQCTKASEVARPSRSCL